MNQAGQKEMQVAALQNGTVIDHIPPYQLFKVIHLLGLDTSDKLITFGNNLHSKRICKKAIIKIEGTFFEQKVLNRIALLAPKVSINIIKDYKVVEKSSIVVPDILKDVVKCGNPLCISNNENMGTFFHTIDKERIILRCHYCEREVKQQEIQIK